MKPSITILGIALLSCSLVGCAEDNAVKEARYDHLPPRTGSNLPKPIPNGAPVNADDVQSYTPPPEGLYRAPPVTFIIPGSRH